MMTGQHVVEVVRDAAGQLADGLHLLHLPQLRLAFQRRFISAVSLVLVSDSSAVRSATWVSRLAVRLFSTREVRASTVADGVEFLDLGIQRLDHRAAPQCARRPGQHADRQSRSAQPGRPGRNDSSARTAAMVSSWLSVSHIGVSSEPPAVHRRRPLALGRVLDGRDQRNSLSDIGPQQAGAAGSHVIDQLGHQRLAGELFVVVGPHHVAAVAVDDGTIQSPGTPGSSMTGAKSFATARAASAYRTVPPLDHRNAMAANSRFVILPS